MEKRMRAKPFWLAILLVCSCLVPTAFAVGYPGGNLPTIRELNLDSTVGSNAKDDYLRASLEINYRETVDLRSATNGYTRYDNAFYPRIKKIKDDLYLLLFMYGQLGPHLYYATSADGQNWNAPQVLYDNRTEERKIHYTDGPLAGTDDRYCATGAEACVLANGDVLCVYAVRPNHGYNDYPDYSGLWTRRGTVNANNTITWGPEEKIYTGHAWEPYIRQHDDGHVEVYWTSIVAYATMYGFDKEKRSTCTMLITSNDNGHTWEPSIRAGDKNHYVATRVYQEYIGDKVPYGTNLAPVPYFGGQMPVAARLYNGKTMLALEVQKLDQSYDVSFAVSGENGVWKPLGLLEEGPETSVRSPFDGTSPYLAVFPSGEVYMTYTHGGGSNLRYRMGSPEGDEMSPRELVASPGTVGMWGSCEPVGSHAVVTAAQDRSEEKMGIRLNYAYLNHRINAPDLSVTVDGKIDDWTGNTDALFVGSESQAQVTLRTAHDAENVYFLLSRLDTDLCDGDTVTIHLGTDDTAYYSVTADLKGSREITYYANGVTTKVENGGKAAVRIFGTVQKSTDADEGALIELSVPRKLVGLAGKATYPIRVELANADGNTWTRDSFTGVSWFSTCLWPMVELD